MSGRPERRTRERRLPSKRLTGIPPVQLPEQLFAGRVDVSHGVPRQGAGRGLDVECAPIREDGHREARDRDDRRVLVVRAREHVARGGEDARERGLATRLGDVAGDQGEHGPRPLTVDGLHPHLDGPRPAARVEDHGVEVIGHVLADHVPMQPVAQGIRLGGRGEGEHGVEIEQLATLPIDDRAEPVRDRQDPFAREHDEPCPELVEGADERRVGREGIGRGVLAPAGGSEPGVAGEELVSRNGGHRSRVCACEGSCSTSGRGSERAGHRPAPAVVTVADVARDVHPAAVGYSQASDRGPALARAAIDDARSSAEGDCEGDTRRP